MIRALAIPFSIAAAGLFFWLFYRMESLVLFALAAALVGLPVGWMVMSVFAPASPNRKCPECEKDGLVPLRPGDEAGVRCTACGHVDEAASTAPLDEHDPS